MTIALQHAGEFTAELANQLLSEVLGEEVVTCSVAPLGEGVGLMSAIARAQLTLASGKQTSVVLKVIAQTENVGISKQLNFYANEINFYRHLADQCPIKSPRCLFADIDAETQDFLLVLEDLGAAAAGDQLKGCDEDLMLKSFENAGRLHGRFGVRQINFPGSFPKTCLKLTNSDRTLSIDRVWRPPSKISQNISRVIWPMWSRALVSSLCRFSSDRCRALKR